MKPLKDWNTLDRGYRFGVKTSYSNFHLGLDVLCAMETQLYAPCDGFVSHWQGHDGGNMIYLKTAGEPFLIRFLHLSNFGKSGSVKGGEVIGYTGNSGLSTGPHLHVDVSKGELKLYDIRNFIDPEKFFMTIKIATIGMPEEVFSEFRDKVRELGGFDLQRTEYEYPIQGDHAGQDLAQFIVNTIYPKEKYVFLYVNSTFSWQLSWYYPKLNKCISSVTSAAKSNDLAFELSHDLIDWFNENRDSLPSIQDLDWNSPTDDMIRAKFNLVAPYLGEDEDIVMTEQEVTLEYNLAFYRDPTPDELAYWSGKPLVEYLKQAVKDRAAFLAQKVQ